MSLFIGPKKVAQCTFKGYGISHRCSDIQAMFNMLSFLSYLFANLSNFLTSFSHSFAALAHQDESPCWQLLHLCQTIIINSPIFQLFIPGWKSNSPPVMYAAFPLVLPNKNSECQSNTQKTY